MIGLLVGILAFGMGALAIWRSRRAGLSPVETFGLTASRRSIAEAAVGLALPFATTALVFAAEAAAGLIEVSSGVHAGTRLAPAVVAAIALAAWRELFYRVLLLTGVAIALRRWRHGRWLAVAATAALLGLAHVATEPDAVQAVCAALEAVLFGIAFLATRAIWMPLTLHVSWSVSALLWGSYVSAGAHASAWALPDPAASTHQPVVRSGLLGAVALALMIVLLLRYLVHAWPHARPGLLRFAPAPTPRRSTWLVDARVDRTHHHAAPVAGEARAPANTARRS